jgi:hypothetical protein
MKSILTVLSALAILAGSAYGTIAAINYALYGEIAFSPIVPTCCGAI